LDVRLKLEKSCHSRYFWGYYFNSGKIKMTGCTIK
jgi:hypothetical protein